MQVTSTGSDRSAVASHVNLAPTVSYGSGSSPRPAPEASSSERNVPDVVRTYSEVRIDPKTRAIHLTVRNASSGEVLLSWPIGSVEAALQAQGMGH